MIFATWSEMNEKAKEYELIGISSFYGIFCDDKDEEEKELRKSNFLSLLLDGVKTGRVIIYGEIQHLQDYIRIVGKGQAYEEHWEHGAESPQYQKRGNTNPRILWLEMFGLEETKIDPVAVLEWMNQRSVGQNFLSGSIPQFDCLFTAGNKAYFCTSSEKQVYAQLQANPNVSFCTYPANFNPVMSIYGKAIFVDDLALKARVFDGNPKLKSRFGSIDNPIFKVFFIDIVEVTTFSFADGPQDYKL